MTTWNSKAALLAALTLSLSACTGAQGLGPLQKIGSKTAKPVALSQAKMANGAFNLVAPRGYCIDKAGLKQRFALLARCDALGVKDSSGVAPIGILTVSVTAAKGGDVLPTAIETANAVKLSRVNSDHSSADIVVFQAEGAPPVTGLDVKHWRATTRIGNQLVGISLYGPQDGRAVSDEGREVIHDLIRRSRAGS